MYQTAIIMRVRGTLIAQYSQVLLEATDVQLGAFQSNILIEKNDCVINQ
jgi:hypothetical protein